MKYIHVNLKRFDIPRALGGVNDYSLKNNQDWAETIIQQLNQSITQFSPTELQFTFYLPEAYLLSAIRAKSTQSSLNIGCQSVINHDTTEGNNIGAYTTMRPASAMVGIGIQDTIIGHSEERAVKESFLGSVSDNKQKNLLAVQTELEAEIKMAQLANMNILYCVGESASDRDNDTWKQALKRQLTFNDSKININKLKIAYEPIWAIGPNRPVPTGQSIQEVAGYIHGLLGADIPVLYGGGLKETNATEIAALPDINGGLIALTNFSDHIGFYPDQFIDIVNKYKMGCRKYEKI